MSTHEPVTANTNGQRLGELTRLLCGAFDGPSIDMLVHVNYGASLYTEFVAPGLPLDQTVFRLLVALEMRGTPEVLILMRAVLKARPNHAEIQGAVRRFYPQVIDPAPGIQDRVIQVTDSLVAFRKLARDPALHALVVESRSELVRIAIEIDVLARYKELHDCLHMVQLKLYRQVTDAVRRFRTDFVSLGTLETYLVELRIIATDAREAATKLPNNPRVRGQEMAWVVVLEAVADDLRTAIEELDEQKAANALRKLKGLLRIEPFRVNQLLALTAQELPLDRLVDTLARAAPAAPSGGSAPPDPGDPLERIRRGVAGLQTLLPGLLGQVTEHWLWQEIEKDLWQAEESLRLGTPETLDEFWSLWPGVRDRVRALCGTDPAASWATDLARFAALFEEAFPAPPTPTDPVRAEVSFTLYRNAVMYRFYLVDKALKTTCDAVSTIGRPLDDLLEGITDVH